MVTSDQPGLGTNAARGQSSPAFTKALEPGDSLRMPPVTSPLVPRPAQGPVAQGAPGHMQTWCQPCSLPPTWQKRCCNFARDAHLQALLRGEVCASSMALGNLHPQQARHWNKGTVQPRAAGRGRFGFPLQSPGETGARGSSHHPVVIYFHSPEEAVMLQHAVRGLQRPSWCVHKCMYRK